MTVSEIKSQIMSATLNSVYVFTGEEVAIQEIYARKIAEVKGQQIRVVDTVSEAIKAPSMSLLGDIRSGVCCYVCRDDLDFLKAEIPPEKLIESLRDNTLILMYTKIDKRSKFNTVYGDYISVFDHLDEYLLTKYIRQRVDMPKADCELLIRLCENDYSRVMLELDKVLQMQKLSDAGVGAILEKLVEDGTIQTPPQDAIFDWVDAVLDGKPRVAFQLLEECQKIGEPALRLLLVLYNNTKNLLQVQGCESKNVANVTGLSGWEIHNAQKHIGAYTNRELVNAMKLIRQMETGIKQGLVDEQYVIPYVMVSMIGGY